MEGVNLRNAGTLNLSHNEITSTSLKQSFQYVNAGYDFGLVLEDSDLTGANLRVANLKNANLKSTILRGAILAGKNVNPDQHISTSKMHFICVCFDWPQELIWKTRT